VRKEIEKAIAETTRRQLRQLQIREPFEEEFELPTIMRIRPDEGGRLEAIEKAGGTEAAEQAVLAGLRHLVTTQNADGSWGASHRFAMTSLALLAFLGHGDGPWSAEFGPTTESALKWMISLGLEQGGAFASDLGPNPIPYEHAIATFALAEAATLCASNFYEMPGLKTVAQTAGQHIIKKQHQSGGWDYGYKTDSVRGGDLSITAWQLQALHACSQTGLEFSDLKATVRKGLDYVESCQKSDGGFGYTPNGLPVSPNGYATLTGAGMLVFQLFGKKSVKPVRMGAKYIQKKSKFGYHTADSDLYGHFYEARAMFFRGGAEWQDYHKMVFPHLIEAQGPDGSWPAPGGGEKINAIAALFQTDAHYRNCLCLLILETYYRDAPLTDEPPKR
jgi:hypothetical protein